MENSILEDFGAVVGYTATRKVIAWFGGRHLYVPRQALASHALADLVGMPVLRAMVAEFGGERIFIPSSSEDDRYLRDREIAERVAAGESTPEIAAAMSLTERRVEQIRAELAERGWIIYAEGYKRAMRRSRIARRASASAPPPVPTLLDFLGTGEVSAESPLPTDG